MANLSQFMAGGKLRYQLFTTSGTFTPSAKLLANGGQVFLEMAGGGGGGGAGHIWLGEYIAGGGGGSSFLKTATTVLAPVTVIIGAGGQAGNSGNHAGVGAVAPGDGGNTSFGSIVCYGGRKADQWRGGAAGSQGPPGANGIYVSGSLRQDGNGGGSGGGGAGRLNGEANTGGGGAGASGMSAISGAGGSGYCLVHWFE